MTSMENTHQDEERARAARDAAWTVGHGIDELREAYAGLVLNVSRARAATVGSRHPLPARALRHWTAALTLTGQAERWLAGGVAELSKAPGVGPIGSAGDLVTALTRAADGVRASAAGLVELRQRVEGAAEALGDASPSSWRAGAGTLDELTARMQAGCAALSAYANGVFGVDPMPGRTARVVALAQASWHPPDSVALGAELAGKLVDKASYRPQRAPVPAHLRIPFRRRVAWHTGRGFWASGGSRLFRPRTDAAFHDDCLRAMLLLTRGNTIWYVDRLDLFHRARVLDGYADALAAAVVVAVDRRLTPSRDAETARRLAARLHDRYDGDTREVPPQTVEALIRAALGESRVPAADSVRLILLQTLLLVDLLADEQPTRGDLAAFRAEAVEVASTTGPARQTAAPTGRERNCDG